MKEDIKNIGVWKTTPNYIILGGSYVGILSSKKIDEIVAQVKSELDKHPDKNVPVSEAELKDSVLKGNTVAVMDAEATTIKAFGQLKPVFENAGSAPLLKALCFNSWISFENGAGNEALSMAPELGHKINPTLPIIAKVRNTNERALHIMHRAGATVMDKERTKTVFNITGLRK